MSTICDRPKLIERPTFETRKILRLALNGDTLKFTSYIDLYLETDNQERFRSKLFEQARSFLPPNGKLFIICNNIPAPVYSIWIFWIETWYPSLHTQGFMTYSILLFGGRHRQLVDLYVVSVLQMTHRLFTLSQSLSGAFTLLTTVNGLLPTTRETGTTYPSGAPYGVHALFCHVFVKIDYFISVFYFVFVYVY